MNWEKIFNEPHVWSENLGPQNDVVLSSRIRLARNLVDRHFLHGWIIPRNGKS